LPEYNATYLRVYTIFGGTDGFKIPSIPIPLPVPATPSDVLYASFC
jgi:hypothetical protein